MSNSKFFGIIVLNGNSQLVGNKEGAEDVSRAILSYKDNYHSYLFTSKTEYKRVLVVYTEDPCA